MKKKQEQGQGIHSGGGSRLRLFSPQSYQKRAGREGRDKGNNNKEPLTEEQRRGREGGRERERESAQG
jgi:hypothetical protein